MANPTLKKSALSILNCGISQKEASLILNVTEKTIGVWKKEFKENGLLNLFSKQFYLNHVEILKGRLNLLNQNPNSDIEDIKKVIWCIQQLNLEHRKEKEQK